MKKYAHRLLQLPRPNEGKTSEQQDQRLKNGWEYTLDFTIRLVRTADGWRFDQFYGTAADEKELEALMMG